MTGVFLSYRGIHRSYAPMFVDWVLRQRFGNGLVFEAGHVNQPGVHFPSSIDEWLDRCSTLVAFIDQHWLDVIELLRNPEDWVRHEILHFVTSGKPIVPVLLDGAQMPRTAQLPAELAQLTKWIGLPMASATADADIRRLVGEIERVSPELVLAEIGEPVPAAPTPASLLRAEHEVFPFRPRSELAGLVTWARAADGPLARLVVGPAGAGKTRLALRLCAQLRGAGHSAVLLSAAATPAALGRLSEVTTRTLVVIDEAESRPTVVVAALRALTEGTGQARVLLLARAHGEWLTDLADDPDDLISVLLDRLGTVRLSPLMADPGDYDVAFAALSSRLGRRAKPGAPSLPTTLLEVQAAALVPDDGSPWIRIAELERGHWQRAAATFGLARLQPRHLAELMAAVTAFGAATEAEAEALIAGLRGFRGASPAEIDNALVLARSMLPGPLPLNPVEPQPLADEIIAQHLRAGGRMSDLLNGLADSQVRRAIVALGSCLAAHPDLAAAVQDLITDVLPLAMVALPAVSSPGPLVAAMSGALSRLQPDDLDPLVAALPLRSEVLAEFAVELTRRALAARHEASDATARLSRLLAVRLVARGGPADEAIAAAEAALDWFRAPDAERAESYATLALARDLAGVGPEAREAGAQAIALFRTIATDDRVRAALATALVNQSRRIGDDTGLAAEAYRILFRLHAARPKRYRSLLADALDLLAARTLRADLGREALRLRRQLATARPDAYRPALAATMFNLGLSLGAGNDEAVDLWRASERLYAELDSAAPGRFRSELLLVRKRLDEAGR